MTAEPRDDSAQPVGNVYDKYGARNPVARFLVARFRRQLASHVLGARPKSVLDVGCGEGVLTADLAHLLPSARVVGLDVPSDRLRGEWRERSVAAFVEGSIYNLPFASREFELVTALEVLEHLERPEDGLAELRRVASRFLLLSVPREPMWRIANVITGRYVGRGGNTPGHLQHWSRRGFVRFAASAGGVVAATGPRPWTFVLVDVTDVRHESVLAPAASPAHHGSKPAPVSSESSSEVHPPTG